MKRQLSKKPSIYPIFFISICVFDLDPALSSERMVGVSKLSSLQNTSFKWVARERSRKATGKPRDEIVRKLDDSNTDGEAAQIPPLPIKRPIYPGETPQSKALSSQQPASKEQQLAPLKQGVPFGPPPPPETWPISQVQTERAECERALPIPDVLYEAAEPIKEGACGLPAPIQLKAFTAERAPSLEMKPSAVLSCKMAKALHRWVDEVLQPKAKLHLDATIIRMNNASAYVCRTRYDDPAQRMSQHAYGNAFDVSEFITAKGEVINILDHWNAGDVRAKFLKEVHAGACLIFGTTLGPEANEAHKNHFHFDVADRRTGICDILPGQAKRRAKETEVQAAGFKQLETKNPEAPKPEPQSQSAKKAK